MRVVRLGRVNKKYYENGDCAMSKNIGTIFVCIRK